MPPLKGLFRCGPATVTLPFLLEERNLGNIRATAPSAEREGSCPGKEARTPQTNKRPSVERYFTTPEPFSPDKGF